MPVEVKRFPALERVIRMYSGMTLVSPIVVVVGLVLILISSGSLRVVGVVAAGFGLVFGLVAFSATRHAKALLCNLTDDASQHKSTSV